LDRGTSPANKNMHVYLFFVLYLAMLKTQVFNTLREKKGKTPKSKKATTKKDSSSTTVTPEVIEKE